MIVDPTEAAAYLKITTSQTIEDLEPFIAAAEAAVSKRVGPLEPTTVVRVVGGGGSGLVLPVVPALSLTSVVPVGGVALDVSQLTLDASTGVVDYVNGAAAFPGRRYAVTYMAGYDPPPDDLLYAVKELVRHLWATQRGGGARRPGAAASEAMSNTLPGAAFTFPIRVEQLLAPYMTLGFA